MHYRPYTAARDLRNESTHLIGVIVGNVSNVFSSLLFDGIYHALQPEGYSVILFNANNNPVEEQNGIEKLLSHHVDGLIIQPSQPDFSAYQSIIDSKTPLIMVDRETKNQPKSVNQVVTNNLTASKTACLELARLGYTHLILLCDIQDISAQTSRIKGFKQAAEQKKMQITVINFNARTDEWLYAQISRSLVQGEKSALVSLMGPLLFNALTFSRQQKLVFPKDIGIFSFDDWNWSRFVGNGIDLIQQQPNVIGETAANNLLTLIQHPNNQISPHNVINAVRIKGHSI